MTKSPDCSIRLAAVRWSLTALRLAVAVAVALQLVASASRADDDRETRPNIVFVLADDLGWTDLGCFGSEYYETPHIDRLAAQGMTFTDAYSNGPNCAPTRACLMSGLYSPRHGVYTVGSGKRGRAKFRKLEPAPNRTDLDTSYVTLAERLKERGYVTAHMGKWHLGQPPKGGPKAHGFDVNVAGDRRGHPPTYFSPYRNPYIEDGPKGEYLTDRLTDEAVQFVEANRERPFFLYLAHYAVHTPIQAKDELTAKYAKKSPSGRHDNPKYAAMIDSLDQSVGRLVAKLEELGLTSRTLFVFTSDNGGVGGYASAGVPGGREITHNAPLRGGKGMLYEGGVRVSTIVKWPGVVEPGTECDEPIISLDFHPTLVEVAGGTIGREHPVDGASLVPLLKDPEAALERQAIYWHFPGYLQASSQRGTWRTTPASAARFGRYKVIHFYETGRTELYDLQNDLSEKHDLAGEQPEKVRELYGRLKSWQQRVEAPLPRPGG